VNPATSNSPSSPRRYRDHLSPQAGVCRCTFCSATPNHLVKALADKQVIYAITAMIDDTRKAFTSSPPARRRAQHYSKKEIPRPAI